MEIYYRFIVLPKNTFSTFKEDQGFVILLQTSSNFQTDM